MTARRALPAFRLEEGVPLGRLTTVGIGGAAAALAQVESVAELEHALVWAAERDLPVVALGLGSNVLVADQGVAALVVRLTGGLAEIRIDGNRLTAGGGAKNAVCLHRARAAGLGGFEFACAIPGTAGGGIRMNAGAYGREWKDVVERALVVDAEGSRWVSSSELRLSYRLSALLPGQVVAAVEFRLERRPSAEIKSLVTDLQRRRKDAQPTNRRTFGSVFKNPDQELGAGRMIDQCGLRGHRIGNALISPRHGNFIENAGGASAHDALRLMAEARRRVLEQFGVMLEREVELLGELELPAPGTTL